MLTSLKVLFNSNIVREVEQYLSLTVDKAVTGPAVSAKSPKHVIQYYRKNGRYFETPTEIFARTFRNYTAMKGGMSINATQLEEENARRKAKTNVKTDAYGWGFPEVDPTEEILNYNNGALRELLKKHLGDNVIKAMMDLMQLETKMVVLTKARPYPDGTVRSWGGKKYVKKNGHWDKVESDTFRNSADKKTDKKSKSANKPKRTIKGTKEMYTELKKLESGARVFLDDLDGDKKKLYNSLTKDGLVTWKHSGSNEYKAVLTAAGNAAVDAAESVKARKNREAKQAKKAKTK